MNTGDSNQNEDWFWLREQVIKLEKRIKREKKRLQRKYDFHKIMSQEIRILILKNNV